MLLERRKRAKLKKITQRNSCWKVEIITENFPSLRKDINLQLQEVEQTPNRINTKKSMPRHILPKLLKTKGKWMKASKEKWHCLWGKAMRVRFLIRKHEARKRTASLDFYIQWNILHAFSDEGKGKEFVIRTLLKECLERLLETERKW